MDHRLEDQDKPIQHGKGEYKGRCNRRACQSPDNVVWYNSSTRAYYCPVCASAINKFNTGLCVERLNAQDSDKTQEGKTTSFYDAALSVAVTRPLNVDPRVPASLVMELRNRTGLAMLTCRKLLIESDSDLDKAEVAARDRFRPSFGVMIDERPL